MYKLKELLVISTILNQLMMKIKTYICHANWGGIKSSTANDVATQSQHFIVLIILRDPLATRRSLDRKRIP